MLIVSKFRDYYDSCIGVGGIDKTTVYNRNTEEIINSKKYMSLGGFFSGNQYLHSRSTIIYDDSHPDYRYFNLKLFYVYLSGTCYILIRTRHGNDITNLEENWYSGEYVEDIITDLLKNHKEKSKWIYGSLNRGCRQLRQIIEDYHLKMTDMVNLKYNSPIVVVHVEDGHGISRGEHIIVNAKLSDYNFQKVMHPFEVFQEINVYLNGPLITLKQPPSEPLSEKDMVKSKGMDKWSFRRKSKKDK